MDTNERCLGLVTKQDARRAAVRRSGLRPVYAVFLAALVLAGTAGCGQSEEAKAAEKKAIAAAEALKTGRLVVKSNRANATVEARLIPSAAEAAPGAITGTVGSPLAGLPPGKYAITLRSEGWPETRGEADVPAGALTEFTLDFPSGSLRLDSLPTGATVRWGQTTLGRTPLVVPHLPPGECELTISYSLWPALNAKVAITANAEARETVRLPHGRLVVNSFPPGATVSLGKRALGQTPLTIERFQAGTKTLTLQAAGFPTVEVPVTLEDQGEVTIQPVLASGYPVMDPAATLRAVWYEPPPYDPNRLSPNFDPFPGFHAQNAVVRNLNRKKLFETWLGRKYRFTGKVKSYDRTTGEIEFTEQTDELSKYRVRAVLSAAARGDPAVVAQLLAKDATFALYGPLREVEESARRGRAITFEFGLVEPLPEPSPSP